MPCYSSHALAWAPGPPVGAATGWISGTSGCAPARTLTHARILLKANQGEAGPGWTDAAIAGALEVSAATVARVHQAYVTPGWTRR